MLFKKLLIVFSLMSFISNMSATDMKLENINGKKAALNEYIGQGKWVVANTWSPTCSACVVELPTLKEFINTHPDIQVIGITLDFPSFGYGKIDVLQKFVKLNPLNYPLYLADIEQTSDLIGRRLVGIPSITIFHPDGRPLVTWPGVIEIEQIDSFIANYIEESNPLMEGF